VSRRRVLQKIDLARLAWFLVLAICLTAGAALLIFSFLTFDQARGVADLLARDGSLESFDSQLFSWLHLPLRIGGFLSLIKAAFLLVFPQRGQAFLGRIPRMILRGFRAFPSDLRASWTAVKHHLLRRDILLTLLGLTLFAVFARVGFIHTPMEHDEAYTFSVFAVQPLHLALSDYHFPNNHLFHTLLVHLSYRLLGPAVWAVRLPAFIAGVLLAPLGFLLARRLYGQWAGIVAGAAIASAPVLIDYSVNARGYTLLALFTLLGWIVGLELKQRSNLFWWSLLAVVCAIGIYTVPVFVYSAAMIFTWLGLTWLCGDDGKSNSRAHFLTGMLVSGLAALVLAVIFYLPVIRSSGLDSIIANPWVTPIPRELYWETLVSRTQETWIEWNQDISIEVTALVIVSWMASLAFYRRISTQRIPLQASLLILPVILWLHRPNPWAKIWLFLVPLMLIWASGGLIGIMNGIKNLFKMRVPLDKISVMVLSTALVIASGYHTIKYYPQVRPGAGPVEQAAVFLKSRLQEDQLIVVTAIDDAPFWYYAYQYHIPPASLRRDRPFRSAYVLVNRGLGQSLNTVIHERGPDAGFLDWESSKVVAQFDLIDVYLIQADHEVIQLEYGQNP